MKNILNHNGTSQLLLANVDDGTNRIIINGEELDSTYWIGENSYVILIDGTPIGIKQISSDSGNIMLQKVPDSVNEYRLVRQSDALCYSHIGQIIESTTLATLEDVQAIYGSDTTWIQHTGYILRGASSGVTANNADKDGGEDTHKLTAAESGLPAHGHGFTQPTVNGGGITNGISGGGHSHSLSNNTNVWRNDGGSNNIASGSSTRRVQVTISLSGDGSHTHTLPSHTHTVSGGAVQNHSGAAASSAHNIMQSYKNVYIWERTS